MKIHLLNNQLIDDIEKVSGKREWDSNELTALCQKTLASSFNSVCAWDNYNPDPSKPYSIVNTDNKTGDHWVGAYVKGKTVYIYDSFARSMLRIMKNFYILMKSKGYIIVMCNKKQDQTEHQINCGLRSFVWLALTNIYGIQQSKNI